MLLQDMVPDFGSPKRLKLSDWDAAVAEKVDNYPLLCLADMDGAADGIAELLAF